MREVMHARYGDSMPYPVGLQVLYGDYAVDSQGEGMRGGRSYPNRNSAVYINQSR
jgi:hypothetical protein